MGFNLSFSFGVIENDLISDVNAVSKKYYCMWPIW